MEFSNTIQALLVAATLLIGAITAYLTVRTSQLNAKAQVHDVQLNGPTHVSDARIAALEKTGTQQARITADQLPSSPHGHWEFHDDAPTPPVQGASPDNAAVRPDQL
jgi:hypothetical protein